MRGGGKLGARGVKIREPYVGEKSEMAAGHTNRSQRPGAQKNL